MRPVEAQRKEEGIVLPLELPKYLDRPLCDNPIGVGVVRGDGCFADWGKIETGLGLAELQAKVSQLAQVFVKLIAGAVAVDCIGLFVEGIAVASCPAFLVVVVAVIDFSN
ncbi:MAG: hypothetical protein F4X62_02865 [Caldilineaceae bacterium SB0662_bin_25]|nr:hypothetical protein [Caldilineaceae bacterium SB0662_bin_25]